MNRRTQMLVGAVVLAIAGTVALTVFVGAAVPNGPVRAGGESAKQPYGVRYLSASSYQDAIDDPATENISLAVAEQRAGTAFTLPPESLVGAITKVVMVGPEEQGGPFDMVVGYSSGIKVFVGYRRDMSTQFTQLSNPDIVFADKRKHVVRELLGVSDAVVIEGGDQVLPYGSVNKVPAQIRWNDDNYSYNMRLGTSKKSLSDLRSAVRSVRKQ